MDFVVLIQTTSDQKQTLRKIAARLLEQKIAACCQISGPIESHYEWQGQLKTSTEWTCSIKTVQSAIEQVSETIQANHNYELPEIICTPVAVGDTRFLDWVREQSGG